MNKNEVIAKKINPNLRIFSHYLNKDWAGLKKGEIFSVYDVVTGKQTHYNSQTKNEAWESVLKEAIYLSQL